MKRALYEKKLKELLLFSLAKWRLEGDATEVYENDGGKNKDILKTDKIT